MRLKWYPSGAECTLEDALSQVGPGWSDIIKALINDLLDLGWDGQIFQIKEKFGGLRFYIQDQFGKMDSPAARKMMERIITAEHQSHQTCEFCGAMGKHEFIGSGTKTLCRKCLDRKVKEREDLLSHA